MTTHDRLVSIVTPVWNGMPYLAACIESVLTQEYPLIEHVIIDAGSTDGSLELLREYSGRFPSRVRFISEPDNGPGDAWSKGVRMAQGSVLGCIGADDLCEPGAIDTIVTFFREHPDADFVHGGCRQVSEDGTVVVHHMPGPFEYRAFVNTARDVATPSAYYTRNVIERIGAIEECGNDFELMLRIASGFQIHRVDATLSTLLRKVGTAFNPNDPVKRAAAFLDDYRASRRHGGSLVSPIALRYYWAAIAARLGIQPTSTMGRAVSGATRALRGLC